MRFAGCTGLRKIKDNHRYILSFVDVFSKFLYMILVKTKSGRLVALALRSIFDERKYSSRRPIWVRTNKGKEFLNNPIQDTFRDEGGIQVQVCTNPDLKCAVVESVHRTIRDRLYKYFTLKHNYRYLIFCLDLAGPTITRFTRRLAWRPRGSPFRTFSRYVTGRRRPRDDDAFVSRKRRFAWAARAHQQGEGAVFKGCRTEFLNRDIWGSESNRAVYEFEDLNGTPIHGQFYREELTPERIIDWIIYKIDKILVKKVRRCVREYLVP